MYNNNKIDSSECSNMTTREYVWWPSAPATRGGKGEPTLVLRAVSGDVQEGSGMYCK
jgi:hypothetical protein